MQIQHNFQNWPFDSSDKAKHGLCVFLKNTKIFPTTSDTKEKKKTFASFIKSNKNIEFFFLVIQQTLRSTSARVRD